MHFFSSKDRAAIKFVPCKLVNIVNFFGLAFVWISVGFVTLATQKVYSCMLMKKSCFRHRVPSGKTATSELYNCFDVVGA